MHEPSELGLKFEVAHNIRLGLMAAALLIFGVGGWAFFTKISGAVIVQGSLVVESSVRDVQHPSGGVIGAIFAKEGAQVEAGEVLLKLDATIIAANLAIVDRQIDEALAKRARLQAERIGALEINFPEELASGAEAETPQIMQLLQAERDVFEFRKRIADGQIAQLEERVARLKDEVVGLEQQEQAVGKQADLLTADVANQKRLWEGGLASVATLREVEGRLAQAEGEQGQLVAKISALGAQISEVKLGILELQNERGNQIADELQMIESKLGELNERRVTVQDQLNRVDIRAPIDGKVVRMVTNTVGGVVRAGEVLMQIVPEDEALSVEVAVLPQDIDQISIGQIASLRFSAFAQEQTPEIDGTVSRVAANTELDAVTGAPVYKVRVSLPDLQPNNGLDTQNLRLGNISLVPGMPVDVFFQTGQRRVTTYLFKPFSDQLNRVFREP